MSNKKLVNRRNDIMQGWQFLISLLKREGKKRKKSINGVFLFGHSSKY